MIKYCEHDFDEYCRTEFRKYGKDPMQIVGVNDRSIIFQCKACGNFEIMNLDSKSLFVPRAENEKTYTKDDFFEIAKHNFKKDPNFGNKLKDLIEENCKRIKPINSKTLGKTIVIEINDEKGNCLTLLSEDKCNKKDAEEYMNKPCFRDISDNPKRIIWKHKEYCNDCEEYNLCKAREIILNTDTVKFYPQVLSKRFLDSKIDTEVDYNKRLYSEIDKVTPYMFNDGICKEHTNATKSCIFDENECIYCDEYRKCFEKFLDSKTIFAEEEKKYSENTNFVCSCGRIKHPNVDICSLCEFQKVGLELIELGKKMRKEEEENRLVEENNNGSKT